jgi:hypothetical protein
VSPQWLFPIQCGIFCVRIYICKWCQVSNDFYDLSPYFSEVYIHCTSRIHEIRYYYVLRVNLRQNFGLQSSMPKHCASSVISCTSSRVSIGCIRLFLYRVTQNLLLQNTDESHKLLWRACSEMISDPIPILICLKALWQLNLELANNPSHHTP